MRGSVQRSTKNSREAHTSQKRALLPRISLLTAVLLVVAILVAAAGGAALAALFSGNAPADLPTQVSDIGAPSDSSPEAGFARDMMFHHAQAVEIAEIVRDRTDSDDVRILAADIALGQQAQIGIMQGWLGAWDLPVTGSEPAMAWMGHHTTDGLMPGMATSKEIERLGELSPERADVLFLRLMIAHHEAAIPMAQAILERTDEPEVRELARAIEWAQRAEIGNMKAMLSQKVGDSAEADLE